MDDFILLLKTKKECIEIKKKIEIFLKERLHLELNDKSRYFPYKMGINFCGYRTFTTHRLLRNSSKKTIKRKVNFWNNLYIHNKLDVKRAMNSINSWLGHASHCNSYHLRTQIFNKCKFIFDNNQTSNFIEKNLISDFEDFKSN